MLLRYLLAGCQKFPSQGTKHRRQPGAGIPVMRPADAIAVVGPPPVARTVQQELVAPDRGEHQREASLDRLAGYLLTFLDGPRSWHHIACFCVELPENGGLASRPVAIFLPAQSHLPDHLRLTKANSTRPGTNEATGLDPQSTGITLLAIPRLVLTPTTSR